MADGQEVKAEAGTVAKQVAPAEISFETSVKIVGGIIAAVAGSYALIDSSNKSYASFDDQVRHEISYWYDLRDKYFNVAQRIVALPNPLQKGEISSLCRLGQVIPSELKGRTARSMTFLEDTGYRQQKLGEIGSAKQNFVDVINEFEFARSLPHCQQLISDHTAQKSVGADRDGSIKTDAAFSAAKAEAVKDASRVEELSKTVRPDIAVTPPVLSRESLTLQAGEAKGYDIDVFWCERPLDPEQEQLIQPLAVKVAQALTTLKIATYPIGRIRLRPLAPATQQRAGYPSSGFEVRGESSESGIRSALTVHLQATKDIPAFTSFESQMKTPFYLSVFVCSAPLKG